MFEGPGPAAGKVKWPSSDAVEIWSCLSINRPFPRAVNAPQPYPCTTMSATSESTSNTGATGSPTFFHTSESLLYAVTHVFLPVWLPDHSNYSLKQDLSLARAVCAASHAYSAHVYGASEQAQWHRITKMLDNLQVSAQSKRLDKDLVISQLRAMQTGGMHTGSL